MSDFARRGARRLTDSRHGESTFTSGPSRPAVSRRCDEARYLAVRSRDARFDGWFFVAVTSTGIYCRPSCPSRPPAARVRFSRPQQPPNGPAFRACKRCVPDATPGSPEWDAEPTSSGADAPYR